MTPRKAWFRYKQARQRDFMMLAAVTLVLAAALFANLLSGWAAWRHIGHMERHLVLPVD
jgi:hypothetical protein